MVDKTNAIAGIILVMKSYWDLPADCNEGELYAYAEVLFDRIESGDSRDSIYAGLADLQAKLDLPASEASNQIADRSIELVREA